MRRRGVHDPERTRLEPARLLLISVKLAVGVTSFIAHDQLRQKPIRGLRSRRRLAYFRFSNRPFGVKRFQTIHHHDVDVAHGLVLLFGIGTKALPSIMGFEDEVEPSLRRPCRKTNGRSKRKCELTSSIVPRGTSFRRSVELEFPSMGFDPARFSCCCRGLFPGPAELDAVNPDAVHDHGQPACQGHDRLFHPAAPGDLHRPGLEPRPFLRMQAP